MPDRPVVTPPPIYLGADHYPEAWPAAQLSEDIRLMKEVGLNFTRLAEFAWSSMETSEGTFDFDWLSRAVDQFQEAGIAVALGTPSAGPPIWFTQKHPESLRVGVNGRVIGHGGRRQCCPNSPIYRERACTIAEKMARTFGKHAGVIWWQIDNEFWEECYCDRCLNAFHNWLAERFGTIETLNERWATVLWSQTYSDFSQVPLPNSQTVGAGHHPALVQSYKHFMSDSYVRFCNAQLAVIRPLIPTPISTNAHSPAFQQIDFRDLFRNLDLVGFDCYAAANNLEAYAFHCAWMRATKPGKPFWMFETSSTHTGGTSVNEWSVFSHRIGSLRAKLWLLYASGCAGVNFWLWRQHRAGQEMEHGSLLYPWGQTTANAGDVTQVAHELAEPGVSDWLTKTLPAPCKTAIHYSVANQWMLDPAPIAEGLRYDDVIGDFFRQSLHGGVRADLVHPAESIDAYATVYSPYLPYIDDATEARIIAFVEAGGTWVLGPLSACRDAEGAAHTDACYGKRLEDWLGVHVRYRMPPAGKVRLKLDGDVVDCRWWCDVYESEKATVLATYEGGAITGMPAIVERTISKGKVVLLGTLPEWRTMQSLSTRWSAKESFTVTPGVCLHPRITADGKPAGYIAVNMTEGDGRFTIDGAEHKIEAYEVIHRP